MHWLTLSSSPSSPFSPLHRRLFPLSRQDDPSSAPSVLHEIPKSHAQKRTLQRTYAFACSATNHWQRQHVRYALNDAWDVLQQRPVAYNVVKANQNKKPTKNKRAVDGGYGQIPVSRSTSATFFDLAFVNAYKTRFTRYKPVLVDSAPAKVRIVSSEGDVGDVTLMDDVVPVADILNELLQARGQNDLQVVVQHQTGSNDYLAGEQTHQADNAEREAAGLNVQGVPAWDHTLVLVSRHVGHAGHSLFRQQCPLVNVEEKRPHFLLLDQWGWTTPPNPGSPSRPSGTNLKTHLPQLLMYARAFHCGRFILTDHVSAVAVRLNSNNINPHLPVDVPLAYRFIHNKAGTAPSPFDPEKPTFRHALCLLAIEALCSMGVLDNQLRPVRLIFDDEGRCQNLAGLAQKVAEEGLLIQNWHATVDKVYERDQRQYEQMNGAQLGWPVPKKPSGYEGRLRRRT